MKSGHEEWDDVCTDALHVGLSVSADNGLHDLECATEHRRTGVSSRVNKVALGWAMRKKKFEVEKKTVTISSWSEERSSLITRNVITILRVAFLTRVALLASPWISVITLLRKAAAEA